MKGYPVLGFYTQLMPWSCRTVDPLNRFTVTIFKRLRQATGILCQFPQCPFLRLFLVLDEIIGWAKSEHFSWKTRGRLIPRNWVSFKNWFRVKRRRSLLALSVLLCSWLLINTLKLQAASSEPIDAFFVLGGSIYREFYVAELAKQHPETPILISQGSEDPCILLIFQRQKAPIHQVWLEKCADSTFDNFYFNIPILNRWGSRKVKLITSGTHAHRAQWMAQILLGAHGIWVEPDIVDEQSASGNQEFFIKTGLDVARSLLWAVFSQVVQPKCPKLIPLAAVDIDAWNNSGFVCQEQRQLQLYWAAQL